ncbi:hypothetical protein HCN44_001845 [Aphidius gifuensis]|uniref:Caspase-8 n=1 Tax=Aphidius gifuensis TaxID=684658 RepID=A0A835CWB2_APHGI|nr:caspase-8-like [Aphidius gifuensis]KAF7996213.1 hypothetical protein HCN44_001845 [Aphidius gifuensis]
MLTTDALPANQQTNIVDNKTLNATIDESVLLKIENDLENYEKLSILFLMYEEENYCIDELIDMIDKSRLDGILCKLILKNIKNWKEKFFESITIIGLKNIIINLGLSINDLESRYSANVTTLVIKIHTATKIMYKLFELLNEQQSQLLCKLIYKDIPVIKFNQNDILESHAFYWLSKKYITISSDGSCDLSKIHKHMKTIGLFDTPIYHDMEKYVKSLDKNVNEEQKIINKQEKIIQIEKEKKKIITNAYVVIINEINFPTNSEYETRYGSNVDADDLRKTFTGMGYTVVQYNDQTEEEIYDIFDNLKNVVNSSNDCIIVCLLSHGFKGGFLSHDAKEIDIETIEKKICCDSFVDKLKILIIQACQGENTGRAIPGADETTTIVTDCRNTRFLKNQKTESVSKYTEFFKFSATINDFVSMRDTQHGSWFINAICEVLRSPKEKEISIEKWTRLVQENVQEKRGKLPNKNFDAAQVPHSDYRLKKKYVFPLCIVDNSIRKKN